METELKQFIEQTRFCQASMLQLAEMLPGDDSALDELIAETVQAIDQKAFVLLVLAALSRERRVDARHLVRGAMLLPYYIWLGTIALRMHGDVPGYLLAAITQTHLKRECEAAALLLTVVWCEEQQEGKLPEWLIPTARKLARHENLPSEAQALLVALAVRTKNDGLLAVTKLWNSGITPDKWQPVEDAAAKFAETYFRTIRKSILDLAIDKPSNVLADGTTMRRSVARIGRNEPCPCGSGKKYKHCCHEKDQGRLQRSSDVAGMTREELQAQPETGLTKARMDRMDTFMMAKLDPLKIPEELLDWYLMRLCAFNLFDCVAAAFEKLGYSDERVAMWKNAVFLATRAGHKDSIRRLVKLHPDPEKLKEEIYSGAALLLAEDDPAELVKLLEECSLEALTKGTTEELQGFAYALMFSKFRALGILVGRGTVPILPQKNAGAVFTRILETRDLLNLSPEDPFGDIMDERFAAEEDDHGKESAELRKAQQNLNTKAQEVKQLKDSLAQLQREIARREEKRKIPTEPARTTAPTATDDQVLKEMRQKVEAFKSALKERHHERNQLRRELQKAHTDLETLRQNAAPAAPEETDAQNREEDLLLPQDAPAVHPVRLIEFPKGFQQTLEGFPRNVARATLIMAGRLAAGEPAAYVGALRLKATPDVMRQRIGSDFRLMFRLWPDRVQVIDLVNRKDLERRIKALG
jgi:hypothetical protein